MWHDVLALAAAIAALGYFFYGDAGRLAAMAGRADDDARRRRYRVRAAKSLLLFGGTAILILAARGTLPMLLVLPAAFAPLAAPFVTEPSGLAVALLPAIVGGSLIGMALARARARRGRLPAMLGNFAMLLPRSRSEVRLALGTAICAAIGEELYFRLLLPLLVTNLTGSAQAGFAVATLLFALAHRYQRWPGMIATGIAGAVLAVLYLASGALWLAIVVHAAIDVNALILRPWAAGMLKR